MNTVEELRSSCEVLMSEVGALGPYLHCDGIVGINAIVQEINRIRHLVDEMEERNCA